MKQILVLGSVNIDLVKGVPRLPAIGEPCAAAICRFFLAAKALTRHRRWWPDKEMSH